MTQPRRALTIIEGHLTSLDRTSGERAMTRLASAGLDLEGAEDLAGLVHQCNGTPRALRRANVLHGLLASAPGDDVVALCALVVLRPELTWMSRLLAQSAQQLEDAEAQVVAVAWELITEAPGSDGSTYKPHAVVDAIWNEVRRSTGLRRRGQPHIVSLDETHDGPAPDEASLERCAELLASAVAHGVLSPRQAVTIAQSRMERRPLTEIARELGRPYEAVRKERRRAELALRLFALNDPWSKSE